MASSSLAHSPAQIISQLLVELGLAAAPTATATWPVYVSNEPTAPDNVVTVYDTQGKDGGRAMFTGELLGFSGFQIRIRAKDHPTGWVKADTIQTTLAQEVSLDTVHVEDTDYLVHAVSNIGDVLSLGKDPNSNRRLFTINAIAAIRQL